MALRGLAPVVVMVAIVAIISIPAAIPMMIVAQPPAIAFPITFVIAPAIVARHYPHGIGVRRPRPVPVVPLPMMAHRIPITFQPNKTRSGGNRPDMYDARRRRRADLDTNGYLGEEHSSKQEREREKLLFHQGNSMQSACHFAS